MVTHHHHHHLRQTFGAGLLATVPIVVTVFFLAWLLKAVTGLIPTVLLLIPSLTVQELLRDPSSAFLIRTCGFLLLLGLIYLSGLLTRSMVVRLLMRWMDALVLRLPMVRIVYGTIQQIGTAVLQGGNTGFFRQVALVEYPLPGTRVIGFITGSAPAECQERTGENLLSVFVPTTPNPTSGFLLFVPESHIIILDMSVVDAVRLSISGCTVKPTLAEGPVTPGGAENPMAAADSPRA